ncbi:TPA: hypothetical protein JI392_RS11870 [Acinetobacter baumannii]|nr:hypothetical protein [Acinetobacter baumannii]NDM19862.1 hypothetical protein [Acinetobacter baumannii]NDX60872.1 hypothetical protein [Acinetobacter baumannii]HBI9039705.1 hypothetical protein [Acinetobacter baumannii]
MTDLNKERMELELSAGVLDRQIDNLKAEIADEYFDDEKLELLIEYAMKLGEVYAQRDLLEKAKAQAVPEKKIYLTCEQLYAAANFGAPNKDPELLETELTIAWFDEAHSGSGYYVYISEYPEEGAMKLERESGAEG